jgi:LysR family transcriptional activator of nhaA
VAKEGHLTRAAKQLHVSQSALSTQIRQLEEQLGDQLFDRAGRQLRLTQVGHRVLEYAENIFNLSNELLGMLEQGDARRTQRLRIGAVATLSRNFQDNFLAPVLKDADVKLVIQSASLKELLSRLEVHKLDLVLSNKPLPADVQTMERVSQLRCERIAQQHVCLVGPPLNGEKIFSFPDDLSDCKLLLPGPTSDIRTQFDLLCQRLGVSVEPFAEVDDMAMLRLLARDSGGVAVVPEIVVQDELHNGRLENYQVLEDVVENFYAISAKRSFEQRALMALLGNVQKKFN